MKIGCCTESKPEKARGLAIAECVAGQVYLFGQGGVPRLCVKIDQTKQMISLKRGISVGEEKTSSAMLYFPAPDAYIGGLNND